MAAADLLGAVEVVDAEAEDGDEVGLGEEVLGVGEAHEGVAGVVLVEAGGEDADDAESLVSGDEAEGGEVALRAGDENGVADAGAEGFGEVFADDDGRSRRDGGYGSRGGVGGERLELCRAPQLDGLEEVADSALVGGDDALDERAAAACAAGDEHLSVEAGGGGGDVGEGGGG